ncbi:MAG: ABC transporter ATP-binding protein [Fuerstiella sp.]
MKFLDKPVTAISHPAAEIPAMNTTTPALAVSHVDHHYRSHQALDDVCFQVERGTLFGLLGPNGSGKTTLFRLLATLLPLQSGTVQVCGLDLKSQSADIRRRLGVTFQSPAVDPRLTVEENLRCHGRIYGIRSGDLWRRMDELLQQFTLADRRRSIVGDLSGGLRRRVELAKGLLHSPELLLLDEPSTGLDPVARRQFWDLIREQQQRTPTTVVVTTHLMEEAEGCEQLLLLDKGRVIRHGSPQELQQSLSGQRLTVRTRDNAACRPQLEALLNATARPIADRLCFRIDNAAQGLQQVMSELGTQVVAAEVAQPTLEDVFLETTGRQLSAGDGESAE